MACCIARVKSIPLQVEMLLTLILLRLYSALNKSPVEAALLLLLSSNLHGQLQLAVQFHV